MENTPCAATSFLETSLGHKQAYYKKIQNSVNHQFPIQTRSAPPLSQTDG